MLAHKYNDRTFGKGTNPGGGVFVEVMFTNIEEARLLGVSKLEYTEFKDFGYARVNRRLVRHVDRIPVDGGLNPMWKRLHEYLGQDPILWAMENKKEHDQLRKIVWEQKEAEFKEKVRAFFEEVKREQELYVYGSGYTLSFKFKGKWYSLPFFNGYTETPSSWYPFYKVYNTRFFPALKILHRIFDKVANGVLVEEEEVVKLLMLLKKNGRQVGYSEAVEGIVTSARNQI